MQGKIYESLFPSSHIEIIEMSQEYLASHEIWTLKVLVLRG